MDKHTQEVFPANEAQEAFGPNEAQNKKVITKHNVNSKMVGVKSVLVKDNILYMTSFDNNDMSQLEKTVQSGYVSNVNKKEKYQVHKANTTIIESNSLSHKLSAQITNPLKKNVEKKDRPIGADLVGIKNAYEKEIFGRPFSNENIHVQIAYNIADIKKVLGKYIGNTSYILNNLSCNQGEIPSDFDLIGVTDYKFSYMDLINGQSKDQKIADKKAQFDMFNKKAEPYFPYFNGILKPSKIKGNKISNEVHNYNVIRVLSFLRQFCMHSNLGRGFNLAKEVPDLVEFLNEIYNDAMKKIDEDFLLHSKNNINILRMLNKDIPVEEIITAYYYCQIRKDIKSLGVNTTTIREMIYNNHFPEIAKAKLIGGKLGNAVLSYMQKINVVFDFVIYRFLEGQQRIEDSRLSTMINDLRGNSGKDEEKEKLYETFAEYVYEENANRLPSNITDIIGQYIQGDNSTNDIAKNLDYVTIVNKIGVQNCNATVFSKAIFVFSHFLDCKENNELLSELIGKFRDIYDLEQIYTKIARKTVDFTEKYQVFSIANCNGIKNELAIIKSIANKKRAVEDNSQAKQRLFLDAAKLLGLDTDGIQFYKKDENGETLLDKNSKPIMTEEFEKVWFRIYGNGDQDRKLRNFICNNIIESSRFFYLVKYCNIKACRRIARNEGIVKFVLGRLPESQIHRYYRLVTGRLPTSDLQAMLNVLAERIKNYDFDELFNSKSSIYNDDAEKQKMQSMLSLYCNVIYIAEKNIVYANSRYFIGFSILARDFKCYNLLKNENNDSIDDYLALTQRFVDEKRHNSHAHKYLSSNLENAKKLPSTLYTWYRNNVAHLSAVTDTFKYIDDLRFDEHTTYYGIFNYVVQRRLFELIEISKDKSGNRIVKESDLPEWLIKCREDVLKYKTYSKNLVKILNMPFAYNLPRYKNLSIEDLFNDLVNIGRARQKEKEEKNKNKAGK